ncbi:MAG: enoyl-CoA hydratase/isomerase family protein [Ottowia sp.]|uniref:enoyl-CoA hydratase/isomerase family protein n=1 Tax=Ottowia sp. TaxID=1898956 RepID=UPI003C775D88
MANLDAGHLSEGGSPELTLGGAVATITLNRPAHRNRLHNDDLRTLIAHFDRINAATEIRAVVLTSQVHGPKPVFCAGYHIGQHGDEHPDARFEQVADALEQLRPVTVCALNGSVYGGATDFVLACDFAIGVEGIEMRMPAAALGMHYYPGGMARYVSRLGISDAKRAFLSAEAFGASELLRMGYVQELVPAEHLQAAMKRRLDQILPLAPLALESLKRSINELGRGDYEPTRLRQRQQESQASHDFAEGCLAFAERRAPRFERH